ncbi:unnamed protein product [Auanema sp. JU1783]|nr:unnamed protein product [Auanema sp. JU1783]
MNPSNQNEIDRIVKELCTVLECSFTSRFRKVEELDGKDVIEIATRFLWKTDEFNKNIIPNHVLPDDVGDKVEVVNRIADLLKKVNIETDYHVLLHGRIPEIKNLCLAFVEKLPTRCINVPLFEVLHIALYMRENIVDSEDAMKSRYIRRDLTHLRNEVPEKVSMRCPKCGPHFPSGREEIINILNGPFGNENSLRVPWFNSINNEQAEDNDKEESANEKKKTVDQDKKFEEEVDKVVAEMVKVGRYDPTDHTDHIQFLQKELEDKKDALKRAQYNRNCLFAEIGSLKKYKEQNDDLIQTFKGDDDVEKRIHSILCDFWVHEIDVKKHWTTTLGSTLSQINSLKRRESYLLKRPFLDDIAKIEKQLRDMTDMASIREDALPMIKKIVRDVPESCTTREDLFAQLDEVREKYGKQREALNRIQTDIDVTKKELVWLSESLVRSFNIIEEELFKYADVIKGEDSYRLFARINLACVESIDTVKANGELERELERVKSRCLELRNSNKPNELSLDIEAMQDQNNSLEKALYQAQQEKKARKDLKRRTLRTELEAEVQKINKSGRSEIGDDPSNVDDHMDHNMQVKKDLKRKLCDVDQNDLDNRSHKLEGSNASDETTTNLTNGEQQDANIN